MMRSMIRAALAGIVACATLALLACGGGSGEPAATRVPADQVGLLYSTMTIDAAGTGSSRLFEKRTSGEPRLIKDAPGSSLLYMLASPDGSMLSLIDNRTMKIIDRATGADVMTLSTSPVSTTGAGPFASWNADSKTFAYSRVDYSGTPVAGIPNAARSGWIEVVDASTQQIVTPDWTKVIPLSQPFWNPVGDEFVAVDFGPATSTNRPLVVGGLEGRRRTLTNVPPGNKAAPVWSPDGKHVVYWVLEQVPDKSGETVPGGLFIVDADGTNAHFLAQALFVAPQGWSPDGKRLAVACPPEGKTTQDNVTHICIVDVGSGKMTNLTSGQTDFGAGFSPDGNTVAYLSDPDDQGLFTLRTIRVSDKHTEEIATGVPYGGYTWARAAP